MPTIQGLLAHLRARRSPFGHLADDLLHDHHMIRAVGLLSHEAADRLGWDRYAEALTQVAFLREGHPGLPELPALCASIRPGAALAGVREWLARIDAGFTAPRAPLTPCQQRVWEALADGKARTAKEIAQMLKRSSEDSVRKRIAAIRAGGRSIAQRRGSGYYRPDAG
jgi:hypothetical protein